MKIYIIYFLSFFFKKVFTSFQNNMQNKLPFECQGQFRKLTVKWNARNTWGNPHEVSQDPHIPLMKCIWEWTKEAVKLCFFLHRLLFLSSYTVGFSLLTWSRTHLKSSASSYKSQILITAFLFGTSSDLVIVTSHIIINPGTCSSFLLICFWTHFWRKKKKKRNVKNHFNSHNNLLLTEGIG